MLLPLRSLSLALLVSFAQSPATATSTPPGGPPLPWAAISIHVSSPETTGWNGGDQPDGVTERGVDLRGLISSAYNFGVMPLRADELSGLPDWARTTRYDVIARVDPDDVPAFKKLSNLSMQETITAFANRQTTGEMLMMQKLLADRFNLQVHWESKERSVYFLSQAKGGLRLKPAADPAHGQLTFSQGHLEGKGVPLSFIASLLAQPLDRTVLDRTGLTGAYDFYLHFQPMEKAAEGANSDPDLFTAVQEQLGLKLQSARASVPVLVVDHVQPPSPN